MRLSQVGFHQLATAPFFKNRERRNKIIQNPLKPQWEYCIIAVDGLVVFRDPANPVASERDKSEQKKEFLMEQTEKRNGFSGGLGFILAAAGSSVGLGNLWSFPYKTSQNGGAAFVFVYVLSVILLGAIVMIAEMYIGKRAQANAVTAYKKVNKNLGWIGVLAVTVPFLVTCYYLVLGGYTVKYTMNSFSDNSKVLDTFSGNVGEVILYSAIFLVLAVAIISAGVKDGIEKASKILMPALLVILVFVVIYCLCLGEGVAEGLEYYLNPDFGELGFKGVLAAMGQGFFSLSVGAGAMLAYGSYMGKDFKVGRSTFWIALFDTAVALLAGLAIFPAIYHYQAETGIALQNNGIVLMFSSLPVVFNTLGPVGKIISFFFFGMVAIAAITSVISMLEVITQFLIQKFTLKRKTASKIVGAVCFAISVPIGISLGYVLTGKEGMTVAGKTLLDVFDLAVTTVFIPMCALGAVVAVGWFMSGKNNKKDIFSSRRLCADLEKDGLTLGKFGRIFAFMVKYIAPPLIAFIEVVGVIDTVFPAIDGTRQFSSSGLTIVLIAYMALIFSVVAYFLFLKNKETGTNEYEFKIVAAASHAAAANAVGSATNASADENVATPTDAS